MAPGFEPSGVITGRIAIPQAHRTSADTARALLPLATAYVLAGRMKPVTRIFLGYAALLMAAGLAVTFSRGGWAAAAVGLLALLVILLGRRQHRIPALLLRVLLLGINIWAVAHVATA